MDKNLLNRKRLLSLTLILAMLFSLTVTAVPASAAETSAVGVFSAAQELAEEAESNGASYNGYIFKVKSDAVMTLDAEEAEGIEGVEYAAGVYTAEDLSQIEDFVSDSMIEYIEPNYMLKLFDSDVSSALDPNDKYYVNEYQWNLDMMKVQDIWAYGIEGQDLDDTVDMNYDGNSDNDPIVIAVIDSGLKEGHEDIDWNRIITGVNFNPSATSTDDVLGHGTFVTGLIMATKDNGVGIAGIAQSVCVMPLKVFQASEVETSVIVSAIQYAVDQKTQFDSTNGAQGTNISVINMSLGGSSSDTTMKTAVEAAITAGIIVVCAAGNDEDTTASYPAQYSIGIGSVDSSGTVSYFSQRLSASNGTGYANKVWVMAPGEDVTSLYYSSTSAYCTASGTSFSSPEMAALAAICKGLDNTLDHDSFKQLLKETAIPKSGSAGTINGQDVEYGWGLVDFAATVNAIIGEMTGTATVTVEVKNEAGTAVPGAKLSIYTTTDEDTRGEPVEPNEDGTYTLNRGRRYYYEVSAEKYDTKTGVFAVLTAERTLTITMEGQTYYTRFVGWNTRGEIIPNLAVAVTRSDGKVISQNADGSFGTRNGEYRYTVSADGYFETTGTFTVDDLTDDTLLDGKYIDVLLYGNIDVCSMTLDVFDELGGNIAASTVITLKNSDQETVELYVDGTYKLRPGAYTYTAEHPSYKTVTGGFVIVEDAKGTTSVRNIYMTDKLYTVYMDILPIFVTCTVTVTNGLGEVETPTEGTTYRLTNGTYRYTVEASGYNTYVGTFTVAGAKLYVDIQLEKGSATIDDGTWNEDTYLTIGSSYYSLTELKKHPTTADYTIGGTSMSVTGITITDVIANFTTNPQTATSVTITMQDGETIKLDADHFASAMIAWSVPDGEGLGLTVDGAQVVVWNPMTVTVNYHEHTEIEEIITQATCTEPGSARYTCVECGNVRTAELPALGHDFVNGVCTRCTELETYEDDAIITIDGVEVSVAQLRQYTTYDTYTMVGYYGSETHYVVGILLSDLVEHFIPDKCVKKLNMISAADGYDMDYASSAFSDTMIAWLIDGLTPGSYESDNGLRVAVDNGASGSWMYSPSVITTTSSAAHTYGEPTVVPPTCIAEGYKTRTCTVCGHTEIYDRVPATGEHEFELWTVLVPPTDTTDGQGVYHCVNCGTNAVRTIPATGLGFAIHNLTAPLNEAPAASVTAPGGGWAMGESNTFTVTSEAACVVLVGDETSGYARLTATAVDGQENTYSFTATVTEETVITILLAGDANSDGEVNSLDLLRIQAAFLGKEGAALDEMQVFAADLSGDGKINSLDILRALAAACGTGTLQW